MSNTNKILELSEKRKALIEQINKEKYSYINITSKDNKANELFHKRILQSIKFPEDFYYDLSMRYKKEIENHELFKIIQKMPKGTLLHHHMTDCIDIDWISKEIMKEENLNNIYVRKFRNKFDILIFTKKPDEKEPYFDTPFKNVIEKYLEENKDKTVYDYFYPKLTILPEDLENAQSNEEAWKVFMPKYFFCYYLIFNKKFYKQHIRNTFKQCINDKIYRFESRLCPGDILDDNFENISINEEFEIYKDEVEYINNSFKLEPKFTFGIIGTTMKYKTDESFKKGIQDLIELQKKYPDLICGIESFENKNYIRNFHDLAPVMSSNNSPDLPWIVHAGETIQSINYNILDAYLIGAKRLGHSVNLFKIGNLSNYIKKAGIVLEINPISNQTLRLIRDLRVHPCIGYHNNGIKICINNDDPTLYNTKGVCYDFFVSSVAMEFDLIDFKCFGINSIDGAQISEELKKDYKNKFLKDWDEFLDFLMKNYENST